MKAKIKYWLKRLCNWRFLICFGLAWMITNGWSYVFIFLGTRLDIKWMSITGTTYLAFLWLPFTPEKLITIPIALWFLKIFFPSDKSIHEELNKELEQEKISLRKKQNKKE